MYDIQGPFAHVPLLRKWRSALFPILACFAYARDILRGKAWKAEYYSFGLHVLELLEIDMADSLMPYVQVGLGFKALCEHSRFDLGRCEDKHTAFSATVSYDSVVFFDEAPLIVEAYLHSLLDYLTD